MKRSRKYGYLHPPGTPSGCDIKERNNVNNEAPFFVTQTTDENNKEHWGIH
jgi:hypothetical protein